MNLLVGLEMTRLVVVGVKRSVPRLWSRRVATTLHYQKGVCQHSTQVFTRLSAFVSIPPKMSADYSPEWESLDSSEMCLLENCLDIEFDLLFGAGSTAIEVSMDEPAGKFKNNSSLKASDASLPIIYRFLWR